MCLTMPPSWFSPFNISCNTVLVVMNFFRYIYFSIGKLFFSLSILNDSLAG